MKNLLRMLVIAAVAATFALPVVAQDAAATSAASAQEEEAKAAKYKEFLDLIAQKTPDAQKRASDVGKEYLSKYPTAKDEADGKILEYVKGWVAKYDKAVLDYEFNKAMTEKNYSRVYELGRQILGQRPDDVGIALTMARAGFLNATAGASANKGLNPEALRVTRQTIQMLDSGKAPAKWEPFANREDALGWLYLTQGVVDTNPDEATKAIVRAAQVGTSVKAEPITFFHLGNAYVEGEYKKAAAEYKATFPDGTEVTEANKPKYDELIAKVNAALDHVIDAYARAIALSTKPEQAKFKADLKNQLSNFYKARHENSTAADVDNFISNVLSKPLPQPGLPVAPPTPAATTGAAPTGAAANTTQPAAATTGAGAAKPAPTPNGAKPASTTTPKPRRK